MSNYDDYDCKQCGHRTENYYIVPGTEEEDQPTCEKCGSTDVARVIAPTMVRFIGQGWETNDHKVARMKKDPSAHDKNDLVDWDPEEGDYVPVNMKGERV